MCFIIQASQEWLSTHFQKRVSTHFVDLQNPEIQPLCGEVDLTGCIISIIDGQSMWLFFLTFSSITILFTNWLFVSLNTGSSPAFYLADGNLNFVKVRCFSSLAQSGLEDVVKPRVQLALSNLQLRGQSTSPTPVVYTGDLAVFSTNPKDVHLQESLSQLRNLVQVQCLNLKSKVAHMLQKQYLPFTHLKIPCYLTCFLERKQNLLWSATKYWNNITRIFIMCFQSQENFFLNAEEKLSHLLKSDGLSSISSPALQTRTPISTTDRRRDTKTNVSSCTCYGIWWCWCFYS